MPITFKIIIVLQFNKRRFAFGLISIVQHLQILRHDVAWTRLYLLALKYITKYHYFINPMVQYSTILVTCRCALYDSGNFVQVREKRQFQYSSISHISY